MSFCGGALTSQPAEVARAGPGFIPPVFCMIALPGFAELLAPVSRVVLC